MFDLKNLNLALEKLEKDRGISHGKMIEALESAFSAAYKREYGGYNQMVRSKFNTETGDLEFFQAKKVVDPNNLISKEEKQDLPVEEQDKKIVFDEEKHILLDDAKKVRSNASEGEEILFPLETKTEFGRIAAQSAKQAIIQKLREAEKEIVIAQFSEKEGSIVSGEVRRFERGNLYIDLGRTNAILPFVEQIRGEKFKQGEKIRAYVLRVDENANRGNFITLSRASEKFVEKLFEQESPEVTNGQVKIRKIVRIPGVRTKIAVEVVDSENLDPVAALVGQRGVRVLTVMNELRGEKIGVAEWNDDKAIMGEEAISPARPIEVTNISDDTVKIVIDEDQINLALGNNGVNLSLAAKLIESNIELHSSYGKVLATSNAEGEVDILIQGTEQKSEEEPHLEEEKVISQDEESVPKEEDNSQEKEEK